jgi:membrane-associated phospholipid phosphatase
VVATAVLTSARSHSRFTEFSSAVVSALTVSADGPAAKECRRLMTLAWAIVALFLVVDVIWFPFSRLTLPSMLWLLWMTLALLTTYTGVWIISRRVKNDTSTMGRFLARVAEGGRLWTMAAGCATALGVVVGIFSYLTASLGLPLRDAELDAIDRALGFDWTDFLAFASASSPVAIILRLAYHSAGPQLIGLYVFLTFARWPQRLAESLAILTIASLLTVVVVTFVPADDAYGMYAPTPELYGLFDGRAGMLRHEILMSLRESAQPVFESVQGIVVFPSFHTTLAIITPYAVRGVRYLFVPLVLLNAIVIVATLPEGGHHLIDLIGGAGVAVAAILLARYWAKGGLASSARRAADFRLTG